MYSSLLNICGEKERESEGGERGREKEREGEREGGREKGERVQVAVPSDLTQPLWNVITLLWLHIP